MAPREDGPCRICGKVGPLTFEHVPPKAAGNYPNGVALDVARYLNTDADAPLSEMRRMKLPRGSGGYYLCASCNSSTGAWYVREYASWASQGERFRARLGNTNTLALPFRILPARVFKQILAIMACTCGHGMFEANPFLRKLVLDRDSHGMPDNLRLYCYLVHPESQHSRSSGVAGVVEGLMQGSSSVHTLAEFAFRPFGYLLTFGGTPPPDRGLLDITFFANHAYNTYRELHLPLPIRPVESYFPADFRTKEEWAQANREAQLSRLQRLAGQIKG